MKLIDRLLQKAKELTSAFLDRIFDRNEDEFIQALGLEPKDYEVEVEGIVMYDSMKALENSCKTAWSDKYEL